MVLLITVGLEKTRLTVEEVKHARDVDVGCWCSYAMSGFSLRRDDRELERRLGSRLIFNVELEDVPQRQKQIWYSFSEDVNGDKGNKK